MNDDLISRGALLEDLSNTITEQSDTLDWINMINRQPIAYDVDKVVEQLEAEKNPMHRADGSLMSERLKISIDKAIEIVKGGGVNE